MCCHAPVLLSMIQRFQTGKRLKRNSRGFLPRLFLYSYDPDLIDP